MPNEQVGGFLVGDGAVMVHLTGLNSTPVGFDEVEGKELRRLDEESQKELMSRIMKRAKKRGSKRGQEEANRMMEIIKDNDFTFVASYGFDAEEGRVRTMSGKPHTPRKLRKDQNIKPEEARMRKRMEAQSWSETTPFTEQQKWLENEYAWSRGTTWKCSCGGPVVEGFVCMRCEKVQEIYGRDYTAESFEAQSKGKSKCSKHYWDLAVRRNPISGERQFFNQCLLCGKKNFSRGGSAMSDRGFFAESYQVREGFDTCEGCGDSPLFVSTQIAGGTYCMDCASRVWRAESPFSSDAFNEGRSAGITMFVPEGDAEDYYSNLDTEYMIFYGLSPDDLAKDIDENSKRYLQFVAGWDDGWNYATLLHEGVFDDDSDSEGDFEDLDYEMAGEWIHKDFPKGLQEYVPDVKELLSQTATLGLLFGGALGYWILKTR